jgi:hypothetical protein
MAIEDTNWTAGTSPITDPAELRRVKEWLREFACDSEWWRVAWRLLRTCEANETAKTQCEADGNAGELRAGLSGG